ncbi:MAG: CatB-related O-acetyltransferase [Bacteroidales bacterium]|nr:CatB-related O-acetyltransferase [Bacteroidales bacterium]
MMSIKYIWSRVIKKIRGAAVEGSSIHSSSKVESGSQFINSSMDKYSFCGYDCQIVNCHIGSFCSIADNVKIGGARHPIEWVGMSPVFYSGRDSIKKKFSTFDRVEDKVTIVGNDVWIGANAIIIQGVKIGNGAVIGAGSVVTHDVGDYEIVAGNPAKVIRKRFSDDIINELLNIRWWNLSDDKLDTLSVYIKEPRVFIKEYYEMNNK